MKPLPVVLLLLICLSGTAQKTATYTNDNRIFYEAIDLFEKEKYAAAHDKFNQFSLLNTSEHEELHIASEYYSGICSLYLFHKDAEYNLEKFVLDHPDTPWVLKVYFELATYNYKRKNHKKALEWFEYVDPRDLPNSLLAEFYFKRGHCYFDQEQYENARHDLAEVKDIENEYQTTAIYYYSHIAYLDGNNQTALDGFNRLSSDPSFAPLVPYYITQIYYKQGRYEDLLAYAPALLDSANNKTTKRLPEIAQIVGDAYYRESQYEEAIPYLELYHENTSKSDLTPNDFFQLGFSYYNTGNYTAALEAFNACSEAEDQLGQTAAYYMGDCYMKLDQKPYARTAFKEASEMDYNLEIKEDALFNYAKLAFELSYNPFHEAIDAFEKYLQDYPNSPRKDEAYEFLLNVYMKSRNYEAALRSLDKIQNKDARTKEAYQVVAYNRAVELFQTGSYDEAFVYFEKVNTYPINQGLVAEALFWKAENAFRQNDYGTAAKWYEQCITQPGGFASSWYEDANYGAGYAFFKQKHYDKASPYFRKYIDSYRGDDPKKLNDAHLRAGDCQYVSKKYDQAIVHYNKSIELKQTNTDYAYFQKAQCLGLKGDKDQKITVLEKLLQDQPASKYTADTKFELARTFLSMEKLAKSKKYFEDILANHSNSPYRKYSLVDLLLIAVKSNNNQEAVSLWNKVLADYPNDPIRTDAYWVVESVLIQEGIDPPGNLVEASEHEGKVYRAAAALVEAGDCNGGIEKLTAYLNKYEPAIFGVEANYFLGECYFKANNVDAALNAYNFVISQPVSAYTEDCLKAAATINYNRKNYAQAKNHYSELEQVAIQKNNIAEAEIGLMRCHYWLGEKTYALQYADKVILNESTPEPIKTTAYLWRGKMRLEDGNYDQAYADFVKVEKIGGEKGAEAKYRMAEIAFKKSAYKPCEKEIFELIEKYSGFAEWKYRGFLLLVDVYVGLDDLYQAKATVSTIINNVSEPWVIDEARKKQAQIEALESGKKKAPGQEEIEINLGGDQPKQD